MEKKTYRIVLTGGPGGGKSTAADLYNREMGDEVALVPEAATLIYTGGFPRRGNHEVIEAAQKAIYHVQINLEDAQQAHHKSKVLLCDRGTIDGAVYWPKSSNDFFKHLDTTIENELERYDAVIFFETAAAGGNGIESANRTRVESLDEAIDLDRRLRKLWSQHKRFVFVPHNKSFVQKVNAGLYELEKIVAELTQHK